MPCCLVCMLYVSPHDWHPLLHCMKQQLETKLHIINVYSRHWIVDVSLLVIYLIAMQPSYHNTTTSLYLQIITYNPFMDNIHSFVLLQIYAKQWHSKQVLLILPCCQHRMHHYVMHCGQLIIMKRTHWQQQLQHQYRLKHIFCMRTESSVQPCYRLLHDIPSTWLVRWLLLIWAQHASMSR